LAFGNESRTSNVTIALTEVQALDQKPTGTIFVPEFHVPCLDLF